MAQRNRIPKMAPVYADGYYVNMRGDTVKGSIQTNPEDKTRFYTEFAFKPLRATKARVYNSRRAKAYGFDGHHFVSVNYDDEKLFMERLASGRLVVYEYRFHGKIKGNPAVESSYFVLDTWEDAKVRELSKINNRYYKKSLKPIIGEEQPAIWERIDKFNFSKQNVLNAVNEFNVNYRKMGN